MRAVLRRSPRAPHRHSTAAPLRLMLRPEPISDRVVNPLLAMDWTELQFRHADSRLECSHRTLSANRLKQNTELMAGALNRSRAHRDPIGQLEDDLKQAAGDPLRFPRTSKL